MSQTKNDAPVPVENIKSTWFEEFILACVFSGVCMFFWAGTNIYFYVSLFVSLILFVFVKQKYSIHKDSQTALYYVLGINIAVFAVGGMVKGRCNTMDASDASPMIKPFIDMWFALGVYVPAISVLVVMGILYSCKCAALRKLNRNEKLSARKDITFLLIKCFLALGIIASIAFCNFAPKIFDQVMNKIGASLEEQPQDYECLKPISESSKEILRGLDI